jgi:hypothetical protein
MHANAQRFKTSSCSIYATAMSRPSEKSDFSIFELAAIAVHHTRQMLKKYTGLQTEK